MQRVRDLGGLHVIGSERHESRRIDNQLRGRAARQGDPGSSRFYLSMEDELMRLFGGQQAESLMQRLRIDDAMPLEVGLVGRIVEQSQARVEGANFDVRKHLLEYDDVLNTQRAKIYEQRNRIFTKDDLSEDVTEMLQAEVNRRVPQALEDREGPWRLLAWLEGIQPPLTFNGFVYPSYTLRLLLEHLFHRQPANFTDPAEVIGDAQATLSRGEALHALLNLAEDSLTAEEEHMVRSVENLLEVARDRFESQLAERLEALDTYFEGLSLEDETDGRTPRQIVEELSGLVHIPLKLSSDDLRLLRDDPQEVAESLRDQITAVMIDQTVTRVIGAVERRLEDDLELIRTHLSGANWDLLTEQILTAIHARIEKRRQRLLGSGDGDGQIARDLEAALPRGEARVSEAQLLSLLMQMPQGARATFDRRTHKRVWRRTSRLTYLYMAARLLENRDPEEVTAEVLKHLEGAQAAIRFAWGRSEWGRLAGARLADLDETTQRGLERILGVERYAEVRDQPLSVLNSEERARVISELGRQALTEIYRQLLLGVISELWVEYLTSMEALRVSIGLEAYAQRDPLVQYKNRAFEMFRTLLDDMRTGVVSRMFTFQPRDLSAVHTTDNTTRQAPRELTAESPAQNEPTRTVQMAQGKSSGKGKRRRRRR